MIKIIKKPKSFPSTIAFECGVCGCEFTANRSDLSTSMKTVNDEFICICSCPVCKNTCICAIAF